MTPTPSEAAKGPLDDGKAEAFEEEALRLLNLILAHLRRHEDDLRPLRITAV